MSIATDGTDVYAGGYATYSSLNGNMAATLWKNGSFQPFGAVTAGGEVTGIGLNDH